MTLPTIILAVIGAFMYLAGTLMTASTLMDYDLDLTAVVLFSMVPIFNIVYPILDTYIQWNDRNS